MRLIIDKRVCIGFEADHCGVIAGKTIVATGPRISGLLESVEFTNDFYPYCRRWSNYDAHS